MKKILFVAALINSSPLLAQQLPEDSTTHLSEVVVTANKFPNKTSLTGKVVQVITRQDIDRAGSRDLSQVINEQSGIYINGANSNIGKDKSIFIRGAKVDHSLIVIDGVPVYDASGIGSNFDIRNIPIDIVERVEILKGSQSTLYGSDAIAGVINIITRKGSTKPFKIQAGASYGSFNTIKSNAGINGRSERFSYNLNYSFTKTHGISEAANPPGNVDRFDKDGFDQHGLSLQTSYQLSQKIKLSPYLRFTKNKGELDMEGFIDDEVYRYNSENLQSGIRNEISIGSSVWTTLYNYNRSDRNYINAFSESDYKANEHLAETFIVVPISKFKLTTGIDFRSSNTDQISTSVFMPPLGKDSVKQSQAAIYAALNFIQLNGFSFEAGGRYNNHSEYGNNFAYSFNPSYLFKERLKLFLNISSGYRTPGLYQLFSVYGNRDLKPEQSFNAEGGVQYFTPNEKANFRVTYFNRTVNDVINYGFTNRFQFINQDKQKDQGFEADAKINLTEKLQAKVFYSYVTGEITTKNNGKDSSFFNLYRRPKNSFGLNLGYQFNNAFFISTQVQAFGKNTDLTFEPPTYAPKEVTLNNYVLVNFYAEYAFVTRRLKVFADLRNLTNTEYMEIYGYNTPGFNGSAGFRLSL
jgi:vitamin B12 transporter